MRFRRFLSNVLAIGYREATIVRHDHTFVMAVIAQPIMFLVLLGWVVSTEPANVDWALLDESGGPAARRIVADVMASGYFHPPTRVQSRESGHQLLRRGKALAMLVLPDDLERNVERGAARVQLLLDGSDPLSAARIGAYTARIVTSAEVARSAVSRRLVSRRDGIDVRQQFRFNATLNERAFFLAGFGGMLLVNFCLSATSLGLVGERENGTYEQVLSLPTTAIEIVLGKILPYVGLAYVITLFSVFAPAFVFGLWPRGSALLVLAVTLPYLLASLAIGVFVSTLARTTAQAVFITMFFIMPSFVLSGALLPYRLMPEGIRDVGALFPLRWYQLAVRRVIERGAGPLEVAVPAAVMVLIFLVLLAGIRWRMKPRLG